MKRMKRVLALLLVMMLACTMLAGCGTDSNAKVIKIGIFEPATGENAGGGKQEVLGIRYAHSLVPTVQIGGEEYKIELVEVDNQSDATKAPSAAQQLVSSKVSVVLGTYGSACAIAAGSIFAENKIPAIGCSCTNPQVTAENDFYFRVCFLDPFQGTVMANLALEQGCKKVGVLTQAGDDYSVGLGTYFTQAFQNAGGTVVPASFQTGETDFSAIVSNFADCDAVFAPSSIETGPLIIKQIRTLNPTCKILASDTWENGKVIENAGAAATDVYFSTFFDENDEENALAKTFVDGYKAWLNGSAQNLANNGGDDTVAAVSALGYDAYMAAIEAIKAAQSTDGTAIRDALKDVEMTGVTGDLSFNEIGDANKNMAYIKTIDVATGTFKFLKTQTVAE